MSDVPRVLDFVGANHRAVIGTFRSDGRPSLSPVTVGVDGDRVVISTRETAYKVKHLRRDPRVTLCVFTDRFFGDWLNLDGEVDEIVSLPDAMDGLVQYYRDISGEHPDWDDYRAAMVRDQRCLLRIRIDRVGPSLQG